MYDLNRSFYSRVAYLVWVHGRGHPCVHALPTKSWINFKNASKVSAADSRSEHSGTLPSTKSSRPKWMALIGDTPSAKMLSPVAVMALASWAARQQIRLFSIIVYDGLGTKASSKHDRSPLLMFQYKDRKRQQPQASNSPPTPAPNEGNAWSIFSLYSYLNTICCKTFCLALLDSGKYFTHL